MAGKQTIHWPSWYFGPNGQSGIFNSIDEVPVGWQDSPDHPDITEAPTPSPPDGPSSWAGHSVDFLIAALRRVGVKIRAQDSPRKLFEKAVEVNAIPAYGKSHD